MIAYVDCIETKPLELAFGHMKADGSYFVCYDYLYNIYLEPGVANRMRAYWFTHYSVTGTTLWSGDSHPTSIEWCWVNAKGIKLETAKGANRMRWHIYLPSLDPYASTVHLTRKAAFETYEKLMEEWKDLGDLPERR